MMWSVCTCSSPTTLTPSLSTSLHRDQLGVLDTPKSSRGGVEPVYKDLECAGLDPERTAEGMVEHGHQVEGGSDHSALDANRRGGAVQSYTVW